MKKINNKNPFINQVLDDEEKKLEKALEREEYQEIGNLEETKLMLKEAAIRYRELNTSKPITIRVNQLDLVKIKAKAKTKNIPYQTLLGVLIRNYADGKTSLDL